MQPTRRRHRPTLPKANARGFYASRQNIEHFNNLHNEQIGGGPVALASTSSSASPSAHRVEERNDLIIREEISAWNGVAVLFKISPKEGSTVNASWPIWLPAVLAEVDHQIRKRLKARGPQKVWIELQVFYRGHKAHHTGKTPQSDEIKEEQNTKQVFITPNGFTVLKAGDINKKLLEQRVSFDTRNENLVQRSDLTIDKLVDASIHMSDYIPLKPGRSFKELPKFLFSKRAIVNVVNNDNRCFGYSVLSGIHEEVFKISCKSFAYAYSHVIIFVLINYILLRKTHSRYHQTIGHAREHTTRRCLTTPTSPISNTQLSRPTSKI